MYNCLLAFSFRYLLAGVVRVGALNPKSAGQQVHWWQVRRRHDVKGVLIPSRVRSNLYTCSTYLYYYALRVFYGFHSTPCLRVAIVLCIHFFNLGFPFHLVLLLSVKVKVQSQLIFRATAGLLGQKTSKRQPNFPSSGLSRRFNSQVPRS